MPTPEPSVAYEPDSELIRQRWSQLRWRETIEDLTRHPADVENFSLQDLHGILGDLAFQLGSMQLEALLYYNLLERAKVDQEEEATAHIKALGAAFKLSSLTKPPTQGGPPNPVFVGLIDWLIKKVASVARAMHQLAVRLLPQLLAAIRRHLRVQGLAFSVGVVLSFPPGITFDFEPAELELDVAGVLTTMIDKFYEGQALLP
jgi:hypothetical protein